MNASWAAILPRTAILVNLEQLLLCSRLSAIIAAQIAQEDPRGNEAVLVGGDMAKDAALAVPEVATLLGMTVDDYRHFVALDPVSANYPWFEYSYKNADLAQEAGQYCVMLKPLGVTSQPSPRNSTFRGDIDFIHIGGISVTRRARVLTALENAGWRAAVVEGCFYHTRERILEKATVGMNIHRHQRRRTAEVARLLTYATNGMLIVSERGEDALLESELQAAVLFASYSLLSSCAAALLQPNTQAINATRRLSYHSVKLIQAKHETKLLGPALASLFPYCGFYGA